MSYYFNCTICHVTEIVADGAALCQEQASWELILAWPPSNTHTHTHAQLDHSHPVISHGCTCWLGFNYLCDLPHKSPAPAGVCWYSMCVHCSGSLPTCVCFLLLAVWPKRTTTGWVICTEIVFVQGIEALWRLLCASTVGCTYSIIVNFF